MPCSRAVQCQSLRKTEHYSLAFLFHFMPAKPETFQSLIHYSNLWAASQILLVILFVSIKKKLLAVKYVVILITPLFLSAVLIWNTWFNILKWKSFAERTHFLGLSVSVVLQFAEEGVLLGQQHFDILHTHSDYPGANVRLKSVDTLVGQRRDKHYLQ